MCSQESAISKKSGIVLGLMSLLCSAFLLPSAANAGRRAPNAIEGLQVEVPAPEADVAEAVRQVSEDRIIHGTYVYEKEKTLTGAHELTSSEVFGKWENSGTLFYKAAGDVVDPRHFKGSNGAGTITVRYIIRAVSPGKTSLRIDAVFTENDRHRSDRSDGSVEAAEYDAILQCLDTIRPHPLPASPMQSEVAQSKPADAGPAQTASHTDPTGAQSTALKLPTVKEEHVALTPPDATTTPDRVTGALKDLEQQIAELRPRVEAQIKSNGTVLRSAPFARAAAMQSLRATSPVVLLVLTPKWYGVETQDGRRGWIRRTEVEPLP